MTHQVHPHWQRTESLSRNLCNSDLQTAHDLIHISSSVSSLSHVSGGERITRCSTFSLPREGLHASLIRVIPWY